MATARDLEDALTRRATAQGVVTRHLNSLKRSLDGGAQINSEEITGMKQKVLDAKGKYDEAHCKVMEMAEALKSDTAELESSAQKVDQEVNNALGHLKASDTQGDRGMSREQTLDQIRKLQASLGPEGNFKSPTKDELRSRIKEIELERQNETCGMMSMISDLKKELQELKLQAGNSRGYISTPADETRQRVTFNDVSSIGNTYLDVDHRTARRSQVYSNTPLRGYDGSTRYTPTHSRSLYPGSYADTSDRMKDVDSTIFHKQMMELSQQQHKSFLASLNTPQVKLGEFSGEPLSYVSFFNNFDELVDAVEDNPRVKLSKLQAHCTGRAAQAIAGCGNFSASEGYIRARRLLKQKFGSEYVITQAWLSKLLSYPPLKAPEEMESFALDLASCKDSLYSMGYQTELRSSHTLSMIVSKLPYFLRNKWRKIHRQGLIEGNCDVVVKLVEIVQEAADEVCDPVFSEMAISKVRSTYEGNVNPGLKKANRRHAINAVEADWNEDLADCDSPVEEYGEMFFAKRERATCAGCGSGQHFTSRCRRFKELNPKERLTFAESKGLCVVCLSSEHTTADCKLPWKCQERTCGKRHHTALHGAFVVESVTEVVNMVDTGEIKEYTVDDLESSGTAGVYLCGASACLPIVPVMIRNGEYSVLTHALLDTGSTLTMFHDTLMDKLRLKGIRNAKLDINTMTSVRRMEGPIVNFEIARPNREEFFPVFEGMAVQSLPIATDHMARVAKLAKWPHLKNLSLPRVSVEKVDILIGQDNAHLLEPIGKIKGGRYEPYAIKTPLGWTIFGSLDKALNQGGIGGDQRDLYFTSGFRKPYSELVENVEVTNHKSGCEDIDAVVMAAEASPDGDSQLKGTLDRFWKIESVPDRAVKSREDQQVLDLWNKEFKLEDGHVVLPIPYKTDPPCPPDNRIMAVKALESQGRYLNKHPVEKKQYVTAMKKNFENGHAIVVPPNQINNKLYTFYLLHHGVDHPRKPNVTRVVKHGSAKYRGVSLNDLTHVGPDLMNRLQAVLLRFRQRKSVATGDVENMFNMVRVVEKHQDSLRFVWWKDHEVGGEIIICRMTTHIFGTGWALAAAMFALRKLAEMHQELFPEKVVRSILDDFYVDDWLDSEDSDAQVIETRKGVSDLLAKGSFNLCKFSSNSRSILLAIEPSKRAKELAVIDLNSCDKLPEECTLGAGWSPHKDAFFYKMRADPKPMTRRGLTSSVASIYDPMGLITPFVVPAKLLMQHTCRSGLKWDDLLEDNVAAQWGRWLRDLDRLDGIDVPRWLGCTATSINTLHHLGDASIRAYGGASYLVVKTEDGKRKSSLVMSKSRLAPVRTQSIPRLEMCASVIVAKLDVLLREYLSVPLEPSHFWSDSTIVLFMLLLDPGRLKTFMGNRVAFIQDTTDIKHWHHVPTDQNPADLLSRGVKLEELCGNKLWFNGPDFLVGEEEDWPKQPSEKFADMQSRIEVRKEKPVYFAELAEVRSELRNCVEDAERTVMLLDAELVPTGHLVASVEGKACELNQSLIKFVKAFDTLWRSVRAVVWLKKFVNWKKLPRHQRVKPDGRITLAEMHAAELEYIKLNQRLYLTRSQIMTPSFRKLFPVDDNGAWRVGGRLDQASISWSRRHPFLVPEDSPLAIQVVRKAHREVAHAGLDRVIAECRVKFWVINGLRIAKRLQSAGVTCVKLRGRPMEQIMAPVHKDRLQFHQPPFISTGVDLFGPLLVVVKRSMAKRYGVVYSCLTSRAVHFELAEDLTVSAFLDSLERFVARRGLPQKMRSDNGTNFVRGKKEIDEVQNMLASEEVQNQMLKKDIEWHMNSPSGSHQGGSWERMIRTARQIIVAITEGRNLTESQMTTVLCRAENIMNSRPLTRMSDDDTTIEALTPNHILCLRAPKLVFPIEFDAARYRDAWKNVQGLASSFWRRWMMYYIPELQRRAKWTRLRENLKVGELVIIVQDLYPRYSWPLAVVEEIYKGADGHVRNVLVRTAKGTYRRPIQKLVRLELDAG